MQTIIHRANERGHNDLGWLKANFSFSFASYYNPDKVHFGALRVLNDDTIAPDTGFGTHPHDNMEIITIVLSGTVAHKDSMGNEGFIKAGEVQVMSAGTGIMHSEYNPSKTEPLSALQIWIFPKEDDIEPRYDQKSFTDAIKPNTLTTLISPVKGADTLWINQDATLSIADFDSGQTISYAIKTPGNGTYILLLEGGAKINGNALNKRDAAGVNNTSSFLIETTATSRLLIIEVPMI